MTRLLLILALFGSIATGARAQSEISTNFFDHLLQEAVILTGEQLIHGQAEVKSFRSRFLSENGTIGTYQQAFSIAVNALLDYEIGEVQTGSGPFKVMFTKRKDDPEKARIELLVIVQKRNPANELNELLSQRNEWMRLCNAHKASELVGKLYTPNAYYYNRGRLISGTEAISAEYGYMNSPGYSLKLTPKHVEFVTDNLAYELGQCSGSYPLPYMLLWQKQANGKWQVLMDSNY